MSEWENGLKPWLGPPPSPDPQTWIPPITPLTAHPPINWWMITASQQVRAGHMSLSLGSLTCETGHKSCSAYSPKWSSWSKEITGSFTHIQEILIEPPLHQTLEVCREMRYTTRPQRVHNLMGETDKWPVSTWCGKCDSTGGKPAGCQPEKLKHGDLSGTSLAVQWLRLHASTAGAAGSIPSQGVNTQRTTWPKKFS